MCKCSVSEKKFYDLCDMVEDIDDSVFPYEYIPSIEEIQSLKINEHIEEHLPYLVYLSNDPFGTEESGELARYIKRLLQRDLILK